MDKRKRLEEINIDLKQTLREVDVYMEFEHELGKRMHLMDARNGLKQTITSINKIRLGNKNGRNKSRRS